MCFTAMCGNVSSVPEVIQVGIISDLKQADHIKWKRPLYDHHAIVESVDHEAGIVHIIEYGTDSEICSSGKDAVVRQREVNDLENMFKYYYGEESCDDVNTVLENARSRLGENKYDLFTNNCEHFARLCKTRDKLSCQITPYDERCEQTIKVIGTGSEVQLQRERHIIKVLAEAATDVYNIGLLAAAIAFVVAIVFIFRQKE